MKKNIYILGLVIFTSCVSKNEYDLIVTSNDSLNTIINEQQTTINRLDAELENLKTSNDNLNQLVEKVNTEKNEIQTKLVETERVNTNINTKELDSKYYSDQEAINTVKDYFNFYERNYVVRNIKVRRKTNASFWVSYEKASVRSADNDFFYNAETKILEYYSDNTYNLKHSY